MRKPTWEYVRKVLDYNQRTGQLTWKRRPDDMFPSAAAAARWNGKLAGKPAFTCKELGNIHYPQYGYRYVGTLSRQRFLAHQLIYFWMTGEWADEVDHIDGDGLRNCWRNLREVTRSQSQKNLARPSHRGGRPLRFGHIGIDQHKSGRFCAYINVDGKRIYSKSFATIEEAIAARKAMQQQFGFTARHGQRKGGG